MPYLLFKKALIISLLTAFCNYKYGISKSRIKLSEYLGSLKEQIQKSRKSLKIRLLRLHL